MTTDTRLPGPAPTAGGARDAGSEVRFSSFALAALSALTPPKAEEPVARLLRSRFESVSENGNWWRYLEDYARDPAESDLPIVALVRALKLSLVELLAISLAASVEDEVMVGRAIAYLQAPLGGSRPTVGLLAKAFAPVAFEEDAVDLLIDGVAARSGLLRVLHDEAPIPERPLALPQHLWSALRGSDATLPEARIGTDGRSKVPLAPSVLRDADKHARGLAGNARRALILRSGSESERRTVAEQIALRLGCRPVFITGESPLGLTPWLLARKLLPVFCFELAPGERKQLPELPYYDGPMLGLTGPDGSVELASGSAVSWVLPVPPAEERELLWRAALRASEDDKGLAAELAVGHRHTAGRIAHLGRLARHHADLAGRDAPMGTDIQEASWSPEGGGLDALAQPMRDPIPNEALVVTDNLRRDLEMLLLRCRARDRLTDGLGASSVARYRPGVRALMVGPSGTGKTLACGWLAGRLGLPLFRVDLASVTSKYVGETEKNLAQLLSRAEQAEVVLLFDEADSIFGKRTEVKDANDRFANAQTNYLLQRIESFDGIVILTSNSRGRFDSAFTRRLDTVVEFPLPGPEERRRLWQSHLGGAHGLSSREVNKLAAATDLCGGHIRNVVLAAAVLAHRDKRAIAWPDIVRGLESEHRKLGKQLPVEVRNVG